MRGRSLALFAALGCAPSPAVPTTTPAAAEAAPEPAPALAGAQALSALAWLAGTHRFTSGTRIVEEVWTAPGGGTMFGINRDLQGDRLVGFEFLRIEARAEGIVYVAHPGGRMPGTEFSLRPTNDADTFVFDNPEHDFPTRVIYRRVDGRHTQARAENDEHALVFDFVRHPDS